MEATKAGMMQMQQPILEKQGEQDYLEYYSMPIAEDRDLRVYVEQIIDSTDTFGITTTGLDNGEWITYEITITNHAGGKLLVQLDNTVYVGSIDADNTLPFGDNIDPTQWRLYGPTADWGETDNINCVFGLQIINISAGANQTIIQRAIARAIANTLSNVTNEV